MIYFLNFIFLSILPILDHLCYALNSQDVCNRKFIGTSIHTFDIFLPKRKCSLFFLIITLLGLTKTSQMGICYWLAIVMANKFKFSQVYLYLCIHKRLEYNGTDNWISSRLDFKRATIAYIIKFICGDVCYLPNTRNFTIPEHVAV